MPLLITAAAAHPGEGPRTQERLCSVRTYPSENRKFNKGRSASFCLTSCASTTEARKTGVGHTNDYGEKSDPSLL